MTPDQISIILTELIYRYPGIRTGINFSEDISIFPLLVFPKRQPPLLCVANE
jgi:hypothetical protein